MGCLNLASLQLSRQAHYDFGMRTVWKILRKCEELKRLSFEDKRQHGAGEALEMLHCQRALTRIIVPGLVPEVCSRCLPHHPHCLPQA